MKKAQIKFGETIGIIIIVYFVLMLGLNWYNSANMSDIQDMGEQQAENRALEKYYTMLYSDFLRRSDQGFERNFFDLTSVKAFSNYSKLEESQSYLESRLGESEIILEVIDPYDDNEKIVLYNNTRELDQNTRISQIQSFTSLVSIRDEERESSKNLVGILRVNVPRYIQ